MIRTIWAKEPVRANLFFFLSDIRPLAEPDMAWGFLGKSERETAVHMRYVRISSELLTPKASARYRLCKSSIECLSGHARS